LERNSSLAFLGEFGMNHVVSRRATEGASPELDNAVTCLGERRNGAVTTVEVVIFRAAELWKRRTLVLNSVISDIPEKGELGSNRSCGRWQ